MGTLIRPVFRPAICFECGGPLARERMIALCVRSVVRGWPLPRHEQTCGACEPDSAAASAFTVEIFTTETEFARHLALQAFGSLAESGPESAFSS
jgi:hypothetical protein